MAVTTLALSSAACGTHLFTGLLLVTDVFATDTSDGVLAASFLLFVSCLVVLAICVSACNLAAPEKANRPDDAAEVRDDLDIENGECRCLPNLPAVSEAESRLPEAEASKAVVQGAATISHEERQAEVSEDIQDHAQATAAEQSSEVVQQSEPNSFVSIEDSVLEGLRQLLVHHLRRSGIIALSESQACLLEHHLPRLSNYSEKIVHTIVYAQRVLANSQAPRPKDASDDAQSTEASTEAAVAEAVVAPTEAVVLEEPRKKTLKLQDREILQLYCDAIKEAEIEADWRGIAEWPARGYGTAVEDLGSHVEEWREGLELLGQAVAFRERTNMAPEDVSADESLRAASGELLKQQLIPAGNRALPAACVGLSVTAAAPSGPTSTPDLQCCQLKQVAAEDLPPPLPVSTRSAIGSAPEPQSRTCRQP